MSLDFLAPRPSEATIARSPLADAAASAGARIEVVDGWERIASFADPGTESAVCADGVGFADRSDLGKIEVQRGREAAGADFYGAGAILIQGGWRCPIRPDRDLYLSEPTATEALLGELEASERWACDLTGSFVAISVAGPLAREAFARFCALDLRERSLPIGGFRPGSVARTPGYVLREGPQQFLLLGGAAFAEYLWQTVETSVLALGGRPVGAAALPTSSGGARA